MSLINKMLQDLDARGAAPGDGVPGGVPAQAAGQLKAVEHERPRLDARVVGACFGGAAACVALAWLGWSQYAQRHGVAQPKPLPMTAVAQPVAVAVAPAPAAVVAVAAPALVGPVVSSAPASAPAP